ncbi:MAG: hypothetical protein AB1497_09715 [Bacillota bacterium]
MKPRENIERPADQLIEELRKCAKDNRISCPAALAVANRLNVSPAKVGEALDWMGVKIHGCQLGCFGK